MLQILSNFAPSNLENFEKGEYDIEKGDNVFFTVTWLWYIVKNSIFSYFDITGKYISWIDSMLWTAIKKSKTTGIFSEKSRKLCSRVSSITFTLTLLLFLTIHSTWIESGIILVKKIIKSIVYSNRKGTGYVAFFFFPFQQICTSIINMCTNSYKYRNILIFLTKDHLITYNKRTNKIIHALL